MTEVRKGADSATRKKKKTTRKKAVGTPKKTATTAAKKRAATKKAAPRKTAPRKITVAKTRLTATTPEARHQLIAQSAFFKAERRGFEGGDPIEDWLEAEREVDGSPTD
ncbi:MAG: DUF2934 domain-containing protein [Gammaproteobacteria bacterium]